MKIRLDLDGAGRVEVDMPDPFFTHMVETLSRYASLDMRLSAAGDLRHHIVEDAALALGAAIRKAMGSVPVERFGWAAVPMDEALVLSAVDLGGRPWCSVELGRVDPMHSHFMRSLASEGRFAFHSKGLSPGEEHHTVEAAYKSLGLALRQALRPRAEDLSTKGTVTWKGA